jgi:hypothetical protein
MALEGRQVAVDGHVGFRLDPMADPAEPGTGYFHDAGLSRRLLDGVGQGRVDGPLLADEDLGSAITGR